MSDALHVTAIVHSLAILLAAVVLAVASALSLAIPFRAFPAWVRWPLAICAKAIAFFPIAALTWGFVGFWLGHLGWPIESLLPSPSPGSPLWKWLLPVLLLAVPLSAELAASLLQKLGGPVSTGLTAKGLNPAQSFYQHTLPRLWPVISRRLHLVVLLGASLLIGLEDILDLPGAGRATAHALRGGDDGGIFSGLLSLAAIALITSAFIELLRRVFPRRSFQLRKKHPSPSAALLDSAIAIGLTRAEGWRRHVFPRRLRQVLSYLFEAGSWAVVWTVLVSAIIARGPGLALSTAADQALQNYSAPLTAGIPPALCALFLWLLGRIVAPRPIPQAHG